MQSPTASPTMPPIGIARRVRWASVVAACVGRSVGSGTKPRYGFVAGVEKDGVYVMKSSVNCVLTHSTTVTTRVCVPAERESDSKSRIRPVCAMEVSLAWEVVLCDTVVLSRRYVAVIDEDRAPFSGA